VKVVTTKMAMEAKATSTLLMTVSSFQSMDVLQGPSANSPRRNLLPVIQADTQNPSPEGLEFGWQLMLLCLPTVPPIKRCTCATISPPACMEARRGSRSFLLRVQQAVTPQRAAV
jgi:hypothetical protein